MPPAPAPSTTTSYGRLRSASPNTTQNLATYSWIDGQIVQTDGGMV
jgi:hypothetical protein